jgi:hypothetical protein
MSHPRIHPAFAIVFLLVCAVVPGTATQAGSIALAWDAVSHPDLDGYRVYYGTASGNYTSFGTADLSATHTLTALQDCTNYFIAVKATAGGEESPSFSNEISGWARPVVTSVAPATVDQGANATLTINGVNFQSGASVQFDNPGISVTGVTVSGCNQLQVQVTVAGSASLGVTDFDIINADQTFGTGSGMLTVVQPPDIDPPIISAVQANPVGDTDATIVWTTDEDSDSQVFYRPVGETVYQQTVVQRGLVSSHSTALTGLSPATDYEYHVRSTDASGNVATSSPDETFTTQSNGFTYLRIESETVTPSGDLEINSGAEAFGGAWINLAQGAANGSPNNPNGSWDLGFNVPSGGTWFFWYRMYGDGGCCDSWFESVDGANSNRIFTSQQQLWEWVEGNSASLTAGLHAVTLGGAESRARVDRILITDDPDFVPNEMPGSDVSAPASATALVATAGDSSVRLDWNNPGDPDLSTVEVRYRTDGTFPTNPSDGVPAGSQPATAGAPATLTLSGLTNGTTYSFSVFVLDGSGNASAPATAQATPVAAPPPIGDVQNLRRTDTTGP